MLLMIDNYDSFTYNLVQYFMELGQEVEVIRNDKLALEDIEQLAPDYLVISPGPCTPNEAGISVAAIRHFAGTLPILGICLGHQSITAAFGGKVVRAEELMHGKTSMIQHDGTGLFRGIPNPFVATRYHSLIAERQSFPECLRVTAWTDDDVIMGLEHRELPVWGMQFHPESILTTEGKALLQNFLNFAQED
ncbi:MAG: anthranilate/aminodeoxychorismate synthase component II [Desulfuromonas sp.]|nr:MAG: anthranilate/aminodeoxychorismate synthase component II [Desulfuromonas sp.]